MSGTGRERSGGGEIEGRIQREKERKSVSTRGISGRLIGAW